MKRSFLLNMRKCLRQICNSSNAHARNVSTKSARSSLLSIAARSAESDDAGKARWPRGAEGSGPVDAAFKAIESLVDSGCNLQLYSVNNITSGTDAQGEVTVRLERGGRIVNGVGSDTDIIIASVKAYIEALNLVTSGGIRQHPQVADV